MFKKRKIEKQQSYSDLQRVEASQNNMELPCMQEATYMMPQEISGSGNFKRKQLCEKIRKGEDYHCAVNSYAEFIDYTNGVRETSAFLFRSIKNLPGFFLANSSHYIPLVGFFPPKSEKPCFVMDASQLLPKGPNVDKMPVTNTDEFAKAVIEKLVFLASQNSEYLNLIPYHIFQKAQNFGIDYETPIIDGYKQRFVKYVFENATPAMDCTNATKDAEEKIGNIQKTILAIREQLKNLQKLEETSTFGGE